MRLVDRIEIQEGLELVKIPTGEEQQKQDGIRVPQPAPVSIVLSHEPSDRGADHSSQGVRTDTGDGEAGATS